ncbi:MAG TPA: class I SAM-dependent methyltransferase [Gemmataceae bacterium]|nr:class I SAM-dependent methyltransferase [Gemmataceae bacterium]
MTAILAPQGPGPGAANDDAPCICCGGDVWAPHFRVLRRCGDCGFIRADLHLTEDDVRALYQADYFRGREYGDYVAARDVHEKNFAARFRDIKRLAPGLRSLFEVGCAYGFWLAYASAQGLPCAGADVCVEGTAYAREVLGQDAVAGDFLTMDIPEGAYDAVCLWDTIEHLAHPEAFVARARRILSPGGWLFVTTGDIGSAAARRRGPRWRMIHPPTHLQYFSRDTLGRLLTRHGFTVASVQSVPVYRSIGEVLGRLAALGRGLTRRVAGVMAAATPSFLQRMGFWLDLGDILFMAGRKDG